MRAQRTEVKCSKVYDQNKHILPLSSLEKYIKEVVEMFIINRIFHSNIYSLPFSDIKSPYLPQPTFGVFTDQRSPQN